MTPGELVSRNPIAVVVLVAGLVWYGARGMADLALWWTARRVHRRRRWEKRYR